MATEKTNADALRLYLTGAASVGAAQLYQSLSLGGYRSSTEAGLNYDIVNPIFGLRVDFVSAANGIGSGVLTAISASVIAWTPPDGVQGAAVTIANGETKVIEGDTPSQYIRVSRVSTTALSGTATILTHTCWGAAIAGRDATVDGLTTYAGFIFKNESGAEITNLAVWIDEDSEARAWVASEAVTDNAITDLSVFGDTTAPDGVTGWDQGTTSGTGLAIGTVAAGASVGLWVKRVVPSDCAATPRHVQAIAWEFDYDGDTYTGGARGFYRVSDDSLEGYHLYRGVDAEPDLSAAAWETFSDLSHVTAFLDYGHIYYFVLRYRNKYGLFSENVKSWVYAFGEEIPPSAPEEINLSAGAAGVVNLTALYESAPDGTNAADTWLIYLTSDGGAPDPDTDTPTEVAMAFSGGIARLDWTSSAFADATTIRVLLRTSRTGGAESTNTTDSSVETSTGGSLSISAGACWFIKRDGETVTRIWTHDANNYIDLVEETNVFRFVVGGNIVAGLTAGGFLGITGTVDNTPYGANMEQIDLLDIDDSGFLGAPIPVALCFAGGDEGTRYRMMEIDEDGNLYVSGYTNEASYPFAEVNTENISWDDPNLDFSGDLANVIMRITQVDVDGFMNGHLHIKGIVTF